MVASNWTEGSSEALVRQGFAGTLLVKGWGVPGTMGEDFAAQVTGLGRAVTLAADVAFARTIAAYLAARDEWNRLADAESGAEAEAYQDNLPAHYEAMVATYRLARDFYQACQFQGRRVEAPPHWSRLDRVETVVSF